MGVSACTTNVVLSKTLLEQAPPKSADFVLTDGTVLTLETPHLTANDVVEGSVKSCTGSSCDQVQRTGGMPFSSIRGMSKKTSNDAALGVIGVFVLVCLIALAIASAPSSSSTNRWGPW